MGWVVTPPKTHVYHINEYNSSFVQRLIGVGFYRFEGLGSTDRC